MSRTTFSVCFYCRQSKVNKKGLAPVECSIVICGQRVLFNLPRKEMPSLFNRKKQPKELVDYLSIERSKINEVINNLMANNIPVTADNLRRFLRTGGQQSYKIKDMFDDYINIIKKRVGVDMCSDVFKKYLIVRDYVLERVDENLEINELTPAKVLDITNDIKADFKASTAVGYLTRFKTFCQYAIDNDKLKVNPFQNIKITKPKTEIEYLTQEELDKIRSKQWECKRLEQVADCLIFQASTGLSYSDMAGLREEDIQKSDEGWFIQKTRIKTNIRYTTVILPFGVAVWQKYGGKLPISSNQKMNNYAKEIAYLCNIKKHLHTHLMRKTFACHLLQSGVRMEVVSKTLGHSSIKVTQSAYAAITDLDILREVREKVK